MPSYLKARGRTSRAYLIAVLILFLVPGPLLGSHFSSAQAAPATSWNPRIACTPTLATVRDILGSSYPSQSLTGSRYQTSSTAGGLPSKRALSPPCNLSNTNGQTVSSLVQINGVYLSSLITQDCATKYDVVNGGGNYPDRNGDGKPDTYCDSTGNIFQIGTTSGYIHVEIDHDWQAAGYCGTGTFCDNVTLAQYVSSGAISLDVQGLVFWDGVELPGHWELHPFTAFQLSFSTRFTNSPSVPSPGVPASFAATVTGATPPYTFRWDFGDGTTSSGTTTTHTYSSQGNYNVTLTTNDSTGQVTKSSKTVSVRPQGFSFAASGDFGSLTDVTGLYNLKLLQDFNPDFFLGLGDFSSNSSVTGDIWCSQFKSQYNNVQIFPGDHDTGGHPAGFGETHSYEKYVNNCALTLNVPIVCGPVSGACYGKEYYFDYPASNPIARFIFASPKIYNMTGVCTQALEPPGNWPNCSSQTSTGNPGQPCTDAFGCWQYLAGNIHYNWVSGAIDNARSIGIRWVIVGMHKLCISASDATCSMGNAFFNMLLQKKVDLIIQAHDNAYERSKQLALNTSTCQNINNDSSGYAVYTSGCVVDNGSQGFYTAGAGTVVVVQGAWINDLYGVNGSATNSQNVLEAPYFVKLMGRNTPGAGNGFAKYIVYAGGIDVQTNFSGIFQDSFSINKRSSSTAVVCSPSTVNEGQSTTCTATVTDTSPGTPITPTGTITFTSTPNGLLASPLKCTLSASASCSVAFNAPAGSGGTTYTLTASYSGDLNHGTGSGTASVTVGTPPPKHDTSTSVNCSPSSVVVNQATSCNATVTDTAASGAKAPTGTVTFTPSGSCALSSPTTNSASCSVSITPSTVGTTSVTASYGGDSSHNSSSGSTSITANPRLTSTSISCPVSATNGTTVSCTATVADTSPGTTRTPTGTVSWSTNGTGAFSSTTCTLSLGSCSVSYTANSPGFHVINGNYGGDSTHTPSSGQATIRVSLMVHSTTTSVSCTPSSVVVNQAATCTATVTDTASSGQTAPTGTVTFTSSGTGSFTGSPCTLGSPTSNSASCQVTYTPSGVGSHGITGAYGGDANHGSSTSSPVFSLAVTLRTTSTSVSCNPSTVAVGQATSCTATVADTSGTGAVTPIGTVTFTPGGPCTLSGGSCSVDITPSAQGALTVSAGYGGDSVHGTSSGSTIVTVNPPSSNNYTISWQGFDWDGSGEETLTLNGQFIASLPAVDTPQNANVYVAFSLNTTLVIQGVNRLTFTHANFDCPVTDSVKNLRVENGLAVVYSNSTVEPLSCAESLTYTFTVGGPPPLNASFTYSPTNSVSGQAISFSATASGGKSPYTFTWNFGDGSSTSGSAVTHTYASFGSFNVTLTATDSSSQSTAVSKIVTVTLRSSATTVTCPASGTVGVALSCSATITDTSPGTASTPTGSVTFAPSGSCTLVSGSCSVNITPTSSGTLNVSATYNGDSTHSASTGSATVNIANRDTSTNVACSPKSGSLGLVSTCTATVADISPGTSSTPSGTVGWAHTNAGFFSAANCTLTSGSCSVTYTATAQGSHVITGSYGGDTTHAASQGSDTLAVAVDTTTTSVSCSPNPVAINQLATCTATVTDTSAVATAPTGTVTFTTSGTGSFTGSPCTLSNPISTSASCAVTYTPTAGAGTHSITGTYNPDSTHAGSFDTFGLNVNLRTTSTTVSCPATGTVGVSLSCSATIADTASGTTSTPTGTVSFTPGGTCALLAGSCSVNITPSASGTLPVSASYSGDSAHATSSGGTSLTVNKRSIAATVSCNPSTVQVGGVSTCDAALADTSPGSTSTPTGSVAWSTSGTGTFSASTCTLVSGRCSVTYNATSLDSGTHTISASYSGDGAHNVGSGTFNLTVTQLHATTTSVSCSPSTVVVNQVTSCTATVADSSGTPTAPTGNVSFSSGGTCTLGTQTANSASCSVNVIPTVAGTLTVSASYGGDPSHNSSTGSTSVTVSPGAPYALVVTSDGKVFRFYQNRTLTQVGQPVTTALRQVAWKPDGSYALIAGDSAVLLKYNGTAFTTISTGISTGYNFWTVSWKQDGSYALIGGSVGILLKYDGVKATTVPNSFATTIYSINWHPSGSYALMVGKGGLTLTYDGTTIRSFSGTTNDLNTAAWNPNGQYALIGGINGAVLRFNGTQVTPVNTNGITGTNAIKSIAFNAAGSLALLVGDNGMVLTYNGSTLSLLPTVTSSWLTAVSWSPSGTAYILGGGGTILTYTNGALTKLPNYSTYPFRAIAWKPQ